MKKNWRWTLLAAGPLLLGAAGQEPAATEGVTAFVNVAVVPMDRDRVVEGQTVVVEGDRIRSVGPAGSTDVPEGALEVDGTGLYLMPGLAEMHAHIPSSSAPRDYLENTLFLYVANGITTIRGMLGEPSHLALREAAERGEIISPRIYTSGPSLNGNSVSSPERGRQMVREQAAAGYDFLKLHPGLSRGAFDAIVETADSAGMPFGGHVSQAVGLRRTLDAGQATIDHLDGYVEALAGGGGDTGSQFFGLNLTEFVDVGAMSDLARRTSDAGVWNVPTMALFPQRFQDPEELADWAELRYVPPQQANGWAASVRSGRQGPLFTPERGEEFLELRRLILADLHAAGAGILLGSDAPQVFNVPGFSIHRELREYELSGMSPFEALQTGTTNVARFYGVEDERGRVAEGMIADLVLVRGNPLADLAHVADPAGVMLRGRWLNAAELESGLERIARGYGN